MRILQIAPSLLTIALGFLSFHGEQPPPTGPDTEKRFPPLQLPPGFKATLFACDPFIEYPSVIAAGPKANQLFVAVDYMTGLGVDIVRRDEVRLIEDIDGDGYADKSTVYATGFNSIQGLAYHDGAVYVMHAPYLTVLRDTKGSGKAVDRRDLLTGLGLKPEDNPPRLHCANGVVVGHDGWLYLALGDHGCNVIRPEGDRLIFNGGGILRCRPDGSDLHVFATGLRNIYDVALDEDLNVFVRDNENDGGTYMIRVCHSFFGADHGYPYLYDDRPEEALAPIGDFGLGSSAGGACYTEAAFPPEFRGNLFFCEWGRSVVRYVPQRSGAGFAPVKELEFAAGAANDPYGFKPTDIVVQRDGAMFVSDWADGQRPKRGRGRIYRITAPGHSQPPGAPATDIAGWIPLLDSPSYWTRLDAQTALAKHGREALPAIENMIKQGELGPRGRGHAVWLRAQIEGEKAIPALLDIARSDPEPRVRAQAIRAIGDLADPMLTKHRLQAGQGDVTLARKLAALAKGQDPSVVLEIVVALGRLRWSEAPVWLPRVLPPVAHAPGSPNPDKALMHAAQQTMRQSGNWPAVLSLLDNAALRPIALRALAEQANETVVEGLMERLKREPNSEHRREYADLLTRVYKKPGPWVYWGYRPAPRPANTVAWEKTEAIEKALDAVLADSDSATRLAVLKRMQREKAPTRLTTLTAWLKNETAPTAVATILTSLREHPPAASRDVLETLVLHKGQSPANRKTALAILDTGEATSASLLALAGRLEDGPVLAEALQHLSKYPKVDAERLMLSKLTSASGEVRAAAADAAGALGLRRAVEPLLQSSTDADLAVRRASLEALRRLKEPRALELAVAALKDPATQLAALRCVGEFGGPEHGKLVAEVARHNRSSEILPLTLGMLTRWSGQVAPARQMELEQTVAALQGTAGLAAVWHVAGPMPADTAGELALKTNSASTLPRKSLDWQIAIAGGIEGRIRPENTKGTGTDWLAIADIFVSEPGLVQFLGGGNGPWKVWVNGQIAHQRADVKSFVADADRFDVSLTKGMNRLLIDIAPVKGAPEFHLRFRRKIAAAAQEQLAQAALTRTGNPERGRKLFLDVNKTQCLKCHRLGEQGERIGPELTGVGNRFARIYIIESILEPSRTIAPSFETLQVQLKDGRALSGVRIAETAEALTLGDAKGDKHVLRRSEIEEMRPSPISTMPEGLERPLTTDEFVDLIAFLAGQK